MRRIIPERIQQTSRGLDEKKKKVESRFILVDKKENRIFQFDSVKEMHTWGMQSGIRGLGVQNIYKIMANPSHKKWGIEKCQKTRQNRELSAREWISEYLEESRKSREALRAERERLFKDLFK